MEDLNLMLFNKLREYDRFMRINRAPGALLSASNSDSINSPAFQRDIVLVLLSEHENGLSQKQLAEKMCITQSTLSVMLDKILYSDEKDTPPAFKVIGSGMVCGPDGCH